jgi:hypothetical protein
LGGLGQGVQGPVGWLSLILGTEHAVGVGEELARWVVGNQHNDLRAFQLCKARLASGTRAISETVYALVIEAVDALADGLGVTSKLFGDLGVA